MRRIVLLVATALSALALMIPASASPTDGFNICVWSRNTYIAGYAIPLTVPYTCSPPVVSP
jgi:hypothetical protein